MTSDSRVPGTVLDGEAVRPAATELPAIRQIAGVITQIELEAPIRRPALLGPNDEQIPLPDSIFCVLRLAIGHLMRGESVSILHAAEELTSQQAADLLNISRPYLIRLVDRGDIPCRRVGTHRRILRKDVELYRAERDKERRRHLRAMVREADELDLYDVPEASAAELVNAGNQ